MEDHTGQIHTQINKTIGHYDKLIVVKGAKKEKRQTD